MKETQSAVVLQQLVSKAEVFTQLGARLSQTAQALHDPGVPPPVRLVEELTTCRQDFADLSQKPSVWRFL